MIKYTCRISEGWVRLTCNKGYASLRQSQHTGGRAGSQDMGSPKKLALILQLVLYIKHNRNIDNNNSKCLRYLL